LPNNTFPNFVLPAEGVPMMAIEIGEYELRGSDNEDIISYLFSNRL